MKKLFYVISILMSLGTSSIANAYFVLGKSGAYGCSYEFELWHNNGIWITSLYCDYYTGAYLSYIGTNQTNIVISPNAFNCVATDNEGWTITVNSGPLPGCQ